MDISLPSLMGEGIGLGLAIAAPIGPVNIEVIRRGLKGGFLPAWLVGCGSTAADLCYVALVYLGVAPLVQRPLFRVPLDFAAAAVLGLLAWDCLKEAMRGASIPGAGKEAATASRRGALASGFLITLSNPMTIVFYFSLFGGAVARLHEASRTTHLLYVLAVVIGCLIWSFCLAAVLGWGRGRIGSRALRILGGISGLALTWFSVRFVIEAAGEALRLPGLAM